MSTSLMVQNKNASLEDCKATGGWLPILSIHSPNSKKNGKPEYAHLRNMVNQMVLIDGGDYTPLGESAEVIYVTRRLKATEYKSGDYKSVFHEVDTGGDQETYEAWRREAQNNVQGYKFGPEFLLYLPEHDKFCTLFNGTRKEKSLCSGPIVDAVSAEDPHNIFTLKTKYLEGKSVKFERMVITAHRSDLDFSNSQPDPEEFKNSVHKFLNPTVFVEDPGDER